MKTKRRALVLCDETARHPFRQSLPPHVRQLVGTPATFALPRFDRDDWRDFMLAYAAATVAAATFFA
jgi:hypothetical protein